MNPVRYGNGPSVAVMADRPGTGRIVPEFGPLRGVRVLDTGRLVAGPWAATFLGEFGAEVIHVEGAPFSPPYADPTRTLSPLVPAGGRPPGAVSESWVQYSRNKLSLGLDLTRPEGRAVFLELAKISDIWIESSRPGTYDKLGLPDRTLWEANPKITIVHVSGFGQTGDPGRISLPSFDLIGQAFSGFLSLQGNPDPAPPTRAGTALNDTVTGLSAAAAALMGYVDAQRSGRGQSVDVAQYESFFILLENMALDFFLRGVVRGRHGSGHPRLFPYDVYRCRDGWVVVAAPTPVSWARLRALLGVRAPGSDDPTWPSQHRDEVERAITAFVHDRSGEELERIGRREDLAISRVYDMGTIAADPHYRARGMLLDWEDPVAGPVRGAGVAPKFDRSPGGVWRGAPWLGQDNVRILGELLGYPEERIASLLASGVIGADPPPEREDARSAPPRGSP